MKVDVAIKSMIARRKYEAYKTLFMDSNRVDTFNS